MSDSEKMDVCHDGTESEDESVAENENESPVKKDVYLPGKPLEEGEELVCDQSAYVMLHQARTGAPCLSFDVIEDNLGVNRENFPLTCYIVAGTQGHQNHVNNVVVMKLHNLHKTIEEEDEEDDELSDNEDEIQEPKFAAASIKHQGGVNRIRSYKYNNITLAASWSELGRVNIWDLTEQLQAVDDGELLKVYNNQNKSHSTKPLFTFSGHQKEGFSMDWSPTMPGVLATGDCRRDIHIWTPSESNSWSVDQRPLIGHTDSVEDLQWSPEERHVLASCSVDRTIRIWDTRSSPNEACKLIVKEAHKNDVNVINWNKGEPFILSGGDDGFLHIWDLRSIRSEKPLASFKHHLGPITTVEWSPVDPAVFASGGEDNQIALWDLSVEKEDEPSSEDIEDLPPQLMFIHQGQTNIKELHWHPQLTNVIISTAESGFNIFRTISF
ncbi:glutamate-rich WD repeat-containing protein 1 [Coccinella septempunctata]|uniref:glutamate-rich WD repeat-containing protein 1 n=1 Tax=Coccinella septempunctata TaxID=41139 RepID=UPI001D061AD2|nr:glutamate-rich WD repeat-containing protein 1 [Coccinella septempunctata]